MGKRRQTDPSTVAGQQGGLGGAGALRLLRENLLVDEIESREFSEPNEEPPTDLESLWDGMEGDGTEESPKIITNDHELRAMENDVEAHYRLGGNIDCSGTSEWEDGFIPVGLDENENTTDTPSVSLDGSGFVVKELYVSSQNANVGLFTSSNEELEVRDIIIYKSTFDTDTERAGAITGNIFQDEEPSAENRGVFSGCLVLDCSIRGELVGGITTYTSISREFSDCGVVNCELTCVNDPDAIRKIMGGFVAWAGGYRWDDETAEENSSIYRNICCYDNEFITEFPEEDLNFGVFTGKAGISDDLSSGDNPPVTEINGVFISGGEESAPFIGEVELQSDEPTGEGLEITESYQDKERDAVGSFDGIDDGDSQSVLEIESISKDDMSGESVIGLTTVDFDSVWSTVVEDEDVAVYDDGLPTLRSLDEDIQITAQGLGDPRKGTTPGLNQKGFLVNVDTGLREATGGELTRSGYAAMLGENTRFGSQHKVASNTDLGIVTDLPDPPIPVENNSAVEDTTDEFRIVSVGGTRDDGEPGVPVQVYSSETNEWLVDEYPDLDDDIEDISEGSGDRTGAISFGDYIILVGGAYEDGEETRFEDDRVFVLDTSSEEPEWTPLDDTLETPMYSSTTAIVDDTLYVFGGRQDDGFILREEYYRIDPEADPGDQIVKLGDVPAGGFGWSSTTSPTVDGVVYLAGEWEEGSDEAGGYRRFFKYDPEEDEFTELAPINGLVYREADIDSEDSGAGWGHGTFHEFNGNLVYIDGFFDTDTDVTYYSIEEDKWQGRLNPRGFDVDSPPWRGTNSGVVKNGVIYMPGTADNNSNFWAYVAESDPFEEDPDALWL